MRYEIALMLPRVLDWDKTYCHLARIVVPVL